MRSAPDDPAESVHGWRAALGSHVVRIAVRRLPEPRRIEDALAAALVH